MDHQAFAQLLGNYGEFVGAVAVVATLFYLALQVRTNTASMRTASRQSASIEFRDWNRLLLEHAAAFGAGIRRYPDVDPQTRSSFAGVLHDLILFFQSIVALKDSGTFDQPTYEAYLNWTSSVLITPGGAAFWMEWEVTYNKATVDALRSRIDEGGLPDITDYDQFSVD
jgi:hypothetical protein